MYGIFTYIWLIFMVNVGKYTIHGCYGFGNFCSVFVNRFMMFMCWFQIHHQPWCIFRYLCLIRSIWIIYIPTLGEKWPDSRGNVGKWFSTNESHGSKKDACFHCRFRLSCAEVVFSPQKRKVDIDGRKLIVESVFLWLILPTPVPTYCFFSTVSTCIYWYVFWKVLYSILWYGMIMHLCIFMIVEDIPVEDCQWNK